MEFNSFDLIKMEAQKVEEILKEQLDQLENKKPVDQLEKKLENRIITVEDTSRDIYKLIRKNQYDPTLMLYTLRNRTSAEYVTVSEVLKDYIHRIKKAKNPKTVHKKLFQKLSFKKERVEQLLEIANGLKKGAIKKRHPRNTDLLGLFKIENIDGNDWFILDLTNSNLTRGEINAGILYFKNQIRLCQILSDARASLKDLADSVNDKLDVSIQEEIILEVYNRSKLMKKINQ